jgi:hypothetical protein
MPARPRETGFRFRTPQGHSWVLRPELRPFLECASFVDIQVVEYGALAFALALRFHLDNGATTDWDVVPYSSHRDPGVPRAFENVEEYALPPNARTLVLTALGDDNAEPVSRAVKLPYLWLRNLNTRVKRSVNCQPRDRSQMITAAFEWIAKNVPGRGLDGLYGDCALSLVLD